MNEFETSSADNKSNILVRVAVLAGFAALVSLGIAYYVEGASKDGFAAFGLDQARQTANAPRSSGPAISGVRYGNVDYMPTASTPASKQKVKNAVSDPALGMPN